MEDYLELNKYKLSKFSDIGYKELARACDIYLTNKSNIRVDHDFKTIYEFTIHDLDYYINTYVNKKCILSGDDGWKFKNGIIRHLLKIGWSRQKIKGRYKKEILKWK